jgi:hypothetical protein
MRFTAICRALARACPRAAAPGIITLALAGLSACAPPPLPLAGPDPSRPEAPAAGVTYSSTTAPYTSRRPVNPAPWRQRNDSVTPGSNQEQQ